MKASLTIFNLISLLFTLILPVRGLRQWSVSMSSLWKGDYPTRRKQIVVFGGLLLSVLVWFILAVAPGTAIIFALIGIFGVGVSFWLAWIARDSRTRVEAVTGLAHVPFTILVLGLMVRAFSHGVDFGGICLRVIVLATIYVLLYYADRVLTLKTKKKGP